MADGISEFLFDLESRASPRTVEWYGWMLEAIQVHLGSRDLESVSASDVKRYLITLRHRPKRYIGQGTLSPVTVAAHLRALRAFFRYWLAKSAIAADPTAGLRPPRADLPPKSLTADQVGALVACLDSGAWPNAARDRALVFFALETGCRAEEILHLQFQDVNLREGWVDVLGKGSKRRRVGIQGRALTALLAYAGDRCAGLVFLSNEGRALHYSGLRQIMRRLSARLGMPLRSHSLRHTFGTLLVGDGVDPSHIQALMGHANIATTQVYVKAGRQAAALRAQREHSILDRFGVPP